MNTQALTHACAALRELDLPMQTLELQLQSGSAPTLTRMLGLQGQHPESQGTAWRTVLAGTAAWWVKAGMGVQELGREHDRALLRRGGAPAYAGVPLLITTPIGYALDTDILDILWNNGHGLDA